MGKNYKPALILDLDGTIVKTKSGETFPQDENDFEIYPSIKDRIVKFATDEYAIVVLSNQGGVAFDSGPSLTEVRNRIQNMLRKLGITLNAVSAEYSHPKGNIFPFDIPFSVRRKPETGMIATLMGMLPNQEHPYQIDLLNSIVVGDMWSDQHLARNLRSWFVRADLFRKNKKTNSVRVAWNSYGTPYENKNLWVPDYQEKLEQYLRGEIF